MGKDFRASMTWLHTWAGLIVGWLLLFIFVTGTIGYFDAEIDRWMKPELPVPQPTAGHQQQLQAISHGETWLNDNAPPAKTWRLFLPGTREVPHFVVQWDTLPSETQPKVKREKRLIDPVTGERLSDPRDTGGGQLLYRMHYKLHYLPNIVATILVGLCTVIMLLGLTTGVVAHRKLFKDFFTLRLFRQQRSWFDMHNILSVLALPFHFMITYSGLAFFFLTLMPLIFFSIYQGNTNKALQDTQIFAPFVAHQNQPTTMLPLSQFYQQTLAIRGDDTVVESMNIDNPNDAAARVAVRIYTQRLDNTEDLLFDGIHGEWLNPEPPPAMARFYRAFQGIHEGLFASIALRWLYFMSGLFGTGTIATGLIFWVQKRRENHFRAHPKHTPPIPLNVRLIEKVNVACIVGLPIAIAWYFCSNRLLPNDLIDRAHWEANVLFIGWFLLVLHALLRPRLNAWKEQLWLAAGAYLLVPVINLFTTQRNLFTALIQQHQDPGMTTNMVVELGRERGPDWAMIGFDLSMLVTSALFVLAAILLTQHTSKPSQQRHQNTIENTPENTPENATQIPAESR